MVLDRIPVALLCAVAKVSDRAVKPGCGRLGETETGVESDPIPAMATCQQLITERAGRGDATLDGPPALLPASVLEPNFIHARRQSLGRTGVGRAQPLAQ